MTPMKKSARLGVGLGNLAVAALTAWGVFRGLPTRWWLVDGGAALVVVAMGVSGAALLADHAKKVALTRVAAVLVLGVGLALFATLAITASWLSGVYGPVGKGGAAIFLLVAALVLPYLVALPAGTLLWLGPPGRKAPEASREGRDDAEREPGAG